MNSWKRIHEWMVKALEEPFFRAELHRVEMSLPEEKETQLQLIEGGKKGKTAKRPVEAAAVDKVLARS